jgi:hypothetical protein
MYLDDTYKSREVFSEARVLKWTPHPVDARPHFRCYAP